MRVELGVYIPVYNSWLENIGTEGESNFENCKRIAIKAEEIGLHSIWIADHMLNPIKGERVGALEAWTTLTALGVITNKIKLGNIVLCYAFRYPAVVAKMASTLDHISKGRLVLGIGACGFKREFDAYGIRWDEHDLRVERMREALFIIKSLWTEETVNFKGKYYEVIDGILEPKPIQKPYPPIWIGGESEATRSVVSELADVWLMRGSSPEEAKRKIDVMEKRSGDRKLEYALPGFIITDKNKDKAMNKLKSILKTEELERNVPSRAIETGLIGAPEDIAERIDEFADVGIKYIPFMFSPLLNNLKEFDEILFPHIK